MITTINPAFAYDEDRCCRSLELRHAAWLLCSYGKSFLL